MAGCHPAVLLSWRSPLTCGSTFRPWCSLLCVQVRMFRPWSAAHLLEVLPASAQTITVLDRTKVSPRRQVLCVV